jgi:hypothetical protein
MSDGTVINLGSGGDTIATEDAGLGYKIPVTKIRTGAIDVDGGDVTPANPLPIGGISPITGAACAPTVSWVNGVNEMSVFDARAMAAIDELRLAMQAVLDVLTSGVLQVSAPAAVVVPAPVVTVPAPVALPLLVSSPIGQPLALRGTPAGEMSVSSISLSGQLDQISMQLDDLILTTKAAFGAP